MTNEKATELTRRLMDLHHELEDRGTKGSDWSLARALEDRIGSGQYLPGDIQEAEWLLQRHSK